MFSQCTSLARLDLRFNQIRPDGSKSFAGVLAQCPALDHLDLSGNRFGDAGAKRLTESWSGPEGRLFLDSVESGEDLDGVDSVES